MALVQAREPFQFYTRSTLREATGLRAVTLPQLLRHLRAVPGSVIYYHTHHFLQQHQYLTPEPPNDFAYWVTEILGEEALGEQLASIDTVQFQTIRALREAIVEVIERCIRQHPLIRLRFVPAEEAFHFVKAISIVLPTPYRAQNLEEFAVCLEHVTIESLYFHIFEARIRLERGRDDFSVWLEEALGERALARAIGTLDPYTRTMEDLHQTCLWLVRQRITELTGVS